MRYLFPRARFVDTDPKFDERQFLAMKRECNEVGHAISDRESPDRVLEEVFDLLHTCETFLRRKQEEGVDVRIMRVFVEQKNRERGYYTDEREVIA